MTIKNLCIITARGGSTRIPHKNISKIAGLPLIAWSINAAKESGIFTHILVSTDDEDIAAVAREHGASVPFLRNGAYDNKATASEAAMIAIEQAEGYWGITYDNIVLLMPTCPLRNGKIIKEQFKYFEGSESKFVLSCAEFGPFKPWWACELDTQNQPKYLIPEALKKRSQDLPKAVSPSGAVWIADRDALMVEKSYYGKGHSFYPIPWVAAIDIDIPEDIVLIETLLGTANLTELMEAVSDSM